MQKSQTELSALIAVVAATALALLLPVAYTWVTSICGFVLLFVLFSYDEAGYRSAFQSVAFSAAAGLGVMLLSVVYYRWLGGKGEVHMANGRIETDWLPLTWLCSSFAICAIDRIRMLAYKDARRRSAGTVQGSFIPQYAAPVESKPPVEYVPQTAEPVIVGTPAASHTAAPTTSPAAAMPAAVANQPGIVSTPAASPTPTVAAPSAAAITPAPAEAPIPLPRGKETEIYVALVGEGLNLMRTVRAEHVGRDFYKIIEEMPEGETWEFTPGQVVRCKKRSLSTGKGWVAVEEAPRAS
jgi:hypothetical protein